MDVAKCLKNLKNNSILLTWSYPYSLNQKKLKFQQQYTDLTEGISIDKANTSANTLIIDMNNLKRN